MTAWHQVKMDVYLLVPHDRPLFSHFGLYARHYMRGSWRGSALEDDEDDDEQAWHMDIARAQQRQARSQGGRRVGHDSDEL